jgi:hypothetical protein
MTDLNIVLTRFRENLILLALYAPLPPEDTMNCLVRFAAPDRHGVRARTAVPREERLPVGAASVTKHEIKPMKTKSLFLKMALATAVLAGVSQRTDAQSNVYSLNVVGYINIAIAHGYTFVANQLNNSNNWLSTVIPSPPLGTRVFLWQGQAQGWLMSDYVEDNFGNTNWTVPDALLTVGKGFIVQNNSSTTLITIVGGVPQGNLTNPIPGNGEFSLLASMVPQSLPLLGADPSGLSFPAIDGATVYFFNEANQLYLDPYTHCSGYGFFDPAGLVPISGPSPRVGQCFWVQNPGPATNWVRNFTVQRPASRPTVLAAKTTAVPAVQGITVSAGRATLKILNVSGVPYTVQFSNDRVIWNTVATNQTGGTWTGPCPGGAQGFYQAVNP